MTVVVSFLPSPVSCGCADAPRPDAHRLFVSACADLISGNGSCSLPRRLRRFVAMFAVGSVAEDNLPENFCLRARFDVDGMKANFRHIVQ